MDPYTATMLAATAGFNFAVEVLKFLQTDQGKQLVEQGLQDRKAWDAFWRPILGDSVSCVDALHKVLESPKGTPS